MSKKLMLVLRLVLVGLCLVYALKNIDLQAFREIVSRYKPWKIAALAGLYALTYLTAAWRLRAIARGRAGFRTALEAHLIGQALNNVLPAKTGEFGKLLHLTNRSRMTFHTGLTIVFWERFFDLNSLLICMMLAMTVFHVHLGGTGLLALLVVLWAMLVQLKLRPELAHWLVNKLPSAKLRRFLGEIHFSIRRDMSPRFLVTIMGLSLAHWCLAVFAMGVGLNWVAGFPLATRAILFVFVCAALGFAVPSTPGSFGVFEAAMVAGLGFLEIPKAEALAIALIIHAVTYIPQTVFGSLVLMKSDLSLRKIRQSAETQV
ncbi:MAG: flippase-like domain-containing protein [Lentisphaerae bacterium]|nr:flippase-like domain-containing protein [Lentisphaerota bacterium]